MLHKRRETVKDRLSLFLFSFVKNVVRHAVFDIAFINIELGRRQDMEGTKKKEREHVKKAGGKDVQTLQVSDGTRNLKDCMEAVLRLRMQK